MTAKDIEVGLTCRFHIYKSFYLLFLSPINNHSIDFLSSEYVAKSCEISDKIFHMENYGKFLSELLSNAKSEFLEKLEDEYTKFFIGPDKLIAPPWQSVYVSEDKTLFSKTTLDVRDKYAKYGLKIARYPNEADDHLAFELNFMLYLAALINEDDALKKTAIYDSLKFLDENLLPWIEIFILSLDLCSSIYIKQVSFYLGQFLKYDKEFLQNLNQTEV